MELLIGVLVVGLILFGILRMIFRNRDDNSPSPPGGGGGGPGGGGGNGDNIDEPNENEIPF